MTQAEHHHCPTEQEKSRWGERSHLSRVAMQMREKEEEEKETAANAEMSNKKWGAAKERESQYNKPSSHPHVEWGACRSRKGRDVWNEAKGFFPKCLLNCSSLFPSTIINNWKLMLIGNKPNFVKFPTPEFLVYFLVFVQWQSYKLEIEAHDSSKANYF